MGLILIKKHRLLLRSYRVIGFLFLIGFSILVANFLYDSFESGVGEAGLQLKGSLFATLDTGFFKLILAPFALYANLYGAFESGYAYSINIVIALLVLCVLLISIVHLDKYLRDEAAATNLLAQQRWQTILKTGSVWQKNIGEIQSRTALLSFGSITSIALCQWFRLFRSAITIAYGFPFLALVSGLIIGMIGAKSVLGNILPIVFFITVFMMPKMLSYDFRGSPETIEKLKTLPLPSWQICLGQLYTPVLFSSIIHWLFLIGMFLFSDSSLNVLFLMSAIFVIPFNFVLYATENTGFLLAPVRLVPVGRVDFDFLGRTLVDFLLKCLVLSFVSATVFIVGVKINSIYPATWVPALVASVTMLVIWMVISLAAVAAAYKRFDVSVVAWDD